MTDDVLPVTGVVANGGSTDDTTPTVRIGLSGTNAAAGDQAQLFNGTSALGSAIVLTSGNISNGFVDVTTAALAQGTYNFNAKITDVAGNTSGASSNYTVTIASGADTTAPTVQSINRVGTTPTNAASVSWTVLFSESVTGVDTSDFALVTTGAVTGAAITGVSGSGSQYTVTANTGTGSGTLGLNLVDNDSILDASTNPLGGTGAGNGNFTGQSYTIDKTAPSVTINQAAGQADPTSASPINFTVTFSETVTSFATGDVTLSGNCGGHYGHGDREWHHVQRGGIGDDRDRHRGGERPGRGGDGCGGQRQPCVDEHGQ